MHGMRLPHEANCVIDCHRNTHIRFFRVGCTPQHVILDTVFKASFLVEIIYFNVLQIT